MLRGRLLGALAVGLLAVFAAPAQAVRLVNPDGTPVGGKWQRWADQAKVPTVRGPVLFVAPAQLCVYGSYVAAGCSEGPPRYGSVYELAASDRDSLYFELGHIFDWRYLSPRNRRYLARFWQAWGAPWWDSAQSIAHGGEDGLGAQFASAYADCASGDWEIGGIGSGSLAGPNVPAPPAIYPKTDTGTCKYISRLASRHRGRWNRRPS